MSEPSVRTATGAVRGRAHPGYRAYLGIPYAAPPTGANRFAAPAPHDGWPRVRDAVEFGPAAPQAPRTGFGSLDMAAYFGDATDFGRDYLTLNVWAPTDASRCPVMVFVHGGGFVSGSPRAPLYDGATFARDGVILVTVTYRLGIPGFLDLPDAPPNRGLLDVLAALDWVQTNIGAFGGDPGNVTLFGQSAGATLVSAVLTTPGAADLIARAIVQSGNGLGAFSREQAARVTHRAAELLGVEPTAAGFAAFPDGELTRTATDLTGLSLRTADRFDPLVGLSAFSLVLDTQPADAAASGNGADIPLLIGTNAEEGNLYLAPSGALERSTEDDVVGLAGQTHDDPAVVIGHYRARMPSADWGEVRSALLGDALFVRGSRRLADAHGSGSTYRYEFAWRSPAVGGRLGAAHTVELPFVFDRLHLPALRGPDGLLGAGMPPQRLADEMHGAWIRFARTGSPGWAAGPPRVFC
ncbi:carboxylesterase/lipase family protein [Mycolicibacterium parafortuitum]|uniref:Carboxylic ester hydrolase n=1 Tax=Mycolicibacterium parafortuitum TaxID=39692 RepID=A0A375YMW6_MYCPF|nr:carboxylesterase family protein [Mycolicibacterium parafortuitum]ORB28603.1 carboxylesterase [Mycolicibacterium parafortuitum]SRX82476.1 carboxylesterase [Streptomyces bingchenggensis BCW-1] [Mycolicibacterium parafortuitum]